MTDSLDRELRDYRPAGAPPALRGKILRLAATAAWPESRAAAAPAIRRLPIASLLFALAACALAGVLYLQSRSARPPHETAAPPAPASHPAADEVETWKKTIEPKTYVVPDFVEGSRFGEKADRVRSHGGGLSTENAIVDALRWLKRHQNAEKGCWEADRYGAFCDVVFGQACNDALMQDTLPADGEIGATSLALLAYLGAGYTHNDGSEFCNSLSMGLYFLYARQQTDGGIGEQKNVSGYRAQHAMALVALLEWYALTDQDLSPHVSRDSILTLIQRATDCLLRWQEPSSGYVDLPSGWALEGQPVSTPMTCLALHALTAARSIGFSIPDRALQGGEQWLQDMTQPWRLPTMSKPLARTGCLAPGEESLLPADFFANAGGTPRENPDIRLHPCTAMALFTRTLLGQKRDDATAAARLLAAFPPDIDPEHHAIDAWYWHYGTLAMFQTGGESWKDWNNAMKDALVGTQKKRFDGCQWGSWDPLPDRWGRRYGRVYITALHCLTLETYYRYNRVSE